MKISIVPTTKCQVKSNFSFTTFICTLSRNQPPYHNQKDPTTNHINQSDLFQSTISPSDSILLSFQIQAAVAPGLHLGGVFEGVSTLSGICPNSRLGRSYTISAFLASSPIVTGRSRSKETVAEDVGETHVPTSRNPKPESRTSTSPSDDNL
jgi:hypothetical protein